MTEVLYKIGTICRLTGFKADLLRTWEKRYGFPLPQRGMGGQRMYDSNNLDLLLLVKELLQGGYSIGELATLDRERLLQLRAPAPNPGPSPRMMSRAEYETPLGRHLSGIVDQIVEAAVACDKNGIENGLEKAESPFSHRIVLHDIIRLSAHRIGDLWLQGECTVAGEHIASAVFSRKIGFYLETAHPNRASTHPRTLCACLPGEEHSMGALLVACHLADLGHNVTTMLGSLPLSELQNALDATNSGLLCLSVSLPDLFLARRSSLIDLSRRRQQRCRIVIGGSGVSLDDEMNSAKITLWPNGQPVTACPEAMFALQESPGLSS